MMFMSPEKRKWHFELINEEQEEEASWLAGCFAAAARSLDLDFGGVEI